MDVLAAYLRGDTLLQCLLGQRIEAFALSLCSQSQLLMKIWWKPLIELARELLSGFDALLATNLKDYIQRSLEFQSQLVRIRTVEICAARQA